MGISLGKNGLEYYVENEKKLEKKRHFPFLSRKLPDSSRSCMVSRHFNIE